MMKLPEILYQISAVLESMNTKMVVVGGSVRDHFLHKKIKDYDIEVFGLERLEELEIILGEFGIVKKVGKSFGVLKFIYQGLEYDFSFPRSEQKIGRGHRGFLVQTDGKMSFFDASKRRDFTINAMGYDILTQKFLDPHGGREDMKKGILSHIDDNTFVEDPLRIYRGIQFCARFEYEMALETKNLCKKMIAEGMLEELPKERVYEEFKKLLLKSEKPSIGFELMRELGVLKYFPELEALIGVEQEPKWHPEGDVWIHTMMVIDSMAMFRSGDDREDLKLIFASLCHDFGKATTTKRIDGRVRALGHEEAGVKPTISFLQKLTNEQKFIDEVVPLVRYHLLPSQFFAQKSSSKAVRRLSTKVNIEELVLVAKADFLGRDTKEAKEGIYEAGDWLLEKAKTLNVKNSATVHFLHGRDLIDLGLTPSPKFKIILDQIYEMQLDGVVSSRDEAIVEVKNILEKRV